MSKDDVKVNENNEVQDKWYIFRVQTGREDGMITSLKNSFEMLSRDGIDGKYYFTDFNVPKKTIVKYVDGKKTEKEVVAYPGYLFLKIRLTDEIILFLRKFFQMNGYGTMLPKAITDAEYEKMISSVNSLTEKSKNFTFAIGQSVKINAGSFAGMKGKIASIDNDKKALVVNVAIFGCDTKVDAEFEQVSIIEDNEEQN